MTKQEAKDAFGKKVKSVTRLEMQYMDGMKRWIKITKSTEGLFIGTRTFSDGELDQTDEFTVTFTPINHYEVGLIVPGWRSKPVPVPLEDCALI